MADPEQHLDRVRAGIFGAAADAYDRYRPPYAGALFDELAALAPDRVLDVGCGTGRAAAPLLARGLGVLGVEPDDRMAAVARARGIDVETASFEEWDDRGRRFDLVVCGTAWHWIEPAGGVPKVAAVLRPGGTFARFWNYHVLDEPVAERLGRVYAEHAPQAHAHGRRPDGAPDDPVEQDAAFTGVTVTVLEEQHTFTAAGWADLVATFSDHATLPARQRAVLLDALRAAIDDDLGGALRATSCTHVLWCRRVPG